MLKPLPQKLLLRHGVELAFSHTSDSSFKLDFENYAKKFQTEARMKKLAKNSVDLKVFIFPKTA